MISRSIDNECLFCQIVSKKVSSHAIFEDDQHLAFLTPYPNTPGFSVVIPKNHDSSYGFAVPENILLDLVKAAKKVALLIDKNLKTKRTGMIMEGYGIDHLHIKLFPMHGISDGPWKPRISKDRTFYKNYTGMIASNDGPKMPQNELERLAAKIRGGA